MAGFRRIGVLVFFVVLLGGTQSSFGQFIQCTQLSPDQKTQAEFCAAHAACRVATTLVKTCADVTDNLRRFYENFSKPKPSPLGEEVLSESERKENELAKLDRMAKTDRKAALDDCISKRGEHMRDFCFENYAGSEELADRRKAESDRLAEKRKTERLNQDDKAAHERALLKVKDDSLQKSLGRECKPEQLNSAYCFNYADEARRLGERLDVYNSDPRNTENLGPLTLLSPGIAAKILQAIDMRGKPGTNGPLSKEQEPGAKTVPLSGTDLPKRESSPVDALFSEAIATAERDTVERENKERVALERRETARRAAEESAAAQRVAAEALLKRDLAEEQAIQTVKVGELYAMGDQFETDGKPEKSRKAFRALIARFPDHALAATAANRLAALSSAGSKNTAAQNPQSDGLAASTSSGNMGASGNCDAQYKVMGSEFSAINARKPANVTTTASMQVVMYMTSQSMELAKGSCKGGPREQELTNGMQAAFDSAQAACRQLSTNPDANCVPKKAW